MLLKILKFATKYMYLKIDKMEKKSILLYIRYHEKKKKRAYKNSII